MRRDEEGGGGEGDIEASRLVPPVVVYYCIDLSSSNHSSPTRTHIVHTVHTNNIGCLVRERWRRTERERVRE